MSTHKKKKIQSNKTTKNSAPKGKRSPQSSQKQGNGEHQPKTFRLFYALSVPHDVASALEEAQHRLKGNWRSVRADQFHITLAYLPAVAPKRMSDLKELGIRLAKEIQPLQVRLRGTGYFPNEGSPRVWFVKAEAEGLDDLAAQFRQEIQALDIETDQLSFKAHVTLARKKGPAPRVPPLLFDQEWTAPKMTLYRSILQKTGPIYQVEQTFMFNTSQNPSE